MLKIEGRWAYDAKSKQVIINLKQVQSSSFVFETPVEFRVYEAGNQTPLNVKFNINAKNSQFNIPLPSKPVLILIDPRVVLLADVDFKENR